MSKNGPDGDSGYKILKMSHFGCALLLLACSSGFCHEELRLRYDVERVGDTDPPSTGGRDVRRPCGRLGGVVAISLFSMAIRVVVTTPHDLSFMEEV